LSLTFKKIANLKLINTNLEALYERRTKKPTDEQQKIKDGENKAKNVETVGDHVGY
jgi:hypothetical protein